MAIFFSELSGSATSTGSFGSVNIDTSISESSPLTVDGTSGRLFTVTDQMSGSIFSANLISGLPVIEAFSDNKVNIGPFSSPIQIDSSGNISGSSSSTGSFGSLVVGRGSTDSTYASSTGGNVIFGVDGHGTNERIILKANTVEIGDTDHFGGNVFLKGSVGGFTADPTLFVQKGVWVGSGNGRGISIGAGNADKKTFIVANGGDLDLHDLYIAHTRAGRRIRMQVVSGSTLTDTLTLTTGSDSNVMVELGGNISGSASSTGSFGMIVTPSDIAGKPAARLHRFAFLRASDHEDNSALGFGSKSGNTIFGYDAGSQIVQNNGSGAANTFIGHYAGHGNASGDENTFIGHVAGGTAGSGDNNTVVGSYAGYNLSSGDDLVLIGKSAGFSITTMSDTVVIGKNAGDALTTGVGRNVAVGSGAMSAITTQTQNIAIGSSALGSATGVSNVIAIGHRAAVALDHGDSSGTIAIGIKALEAANGSHAENIAIGVDAMKVHTSGGNNIAIGQNVMDDTDAGSTSSDSDDNLAIGKDSMGGTWANVKSEKNIAIGNYTMDSALNGALHNVAIGWSALSAITEGDSNTVVGYNSGLSITTGIRNVGLGLTTLDAVTTGTRNVALGTNAGSSITTTSYNIFIGNDAGANATGTGAVGIGHDALKAYTGNYAVAIGYEAGVNLTSGANQVSIGYQAGKALTTAANSVFIGYQAGAVHTGGNNVAIGDRAFSNTDAGASSLASSKNVAIGNRAMGGDLTNAAVQGTVAIGYFALQNATMGGINYNIAIGMESQQANTGGQNVAIGYATLKVADGGETGNVAIGTSTMDAVNNDGSDHNVAVGNYSLRGGTGLLARNIAIGHQSMDGTGAVDGSDNTFIGYQAGSGTWTTAASYNNIGIGSYALDAALNGAIYNVAIGVSTLSDLTTGDNNVAIGQGAMQELTTASGNIAIGRATMNVHKNGSYNIAIGNQAMTDTNAGSTSEASAHNIFIGNLAGGGTWTNVASNYNVAIGNYAMESALNGALNNTALGHYTLSDLTTGDSNTAFGYAAGNSLTTGYSNILIGRNAGGSATDMTQTVIIGMYAGDAINTNNSNGSVLIGYQAGTSQTGGINTFIGYDSGRYNSAGTQNTAVGYAALKGASGNSHSNNVAVGYIALTSVTTGGNNVAIGTNAGNSLKTGEQNVFVGTNAGFNATGSQSSGVAVGYNAGYQNFNTSTVYVGRYAGYAGSGHIGVGNIALGHQALFTNRSTDETGCKWNIAIGRSAMSNTTDTLGAAHSNVAIGYYALNNIESGSRNIAIGGQQGGGDGGTGEYLKNGDDNTFVGS